MNAPNESEGEPERSEDASATSRRSFLRGAGIAAAGAAAGGIVGGVVGGVVGASVGRASVRSEVGPELAALPVPSKAGFDHLVVIMFENRSFDNILGFLYADERPARGQRFEGLDVRRDSNRDPLTGQDIPVHVYNGTTDFVMSQPHPDPGEEYPFVNQQLFGTVDPPDNEGKFFWEMKPPFNAPPDGRRADMSGFLADYINHLRIDRGGATPTIDEYRHIMGAFDPTMLPVFSTLAREFAVYDHWHCAVPSQTFCNRSFFHAATSHGFVTNNGSGGFRKWFEVPRDAPTIFNRLEDAGVDWAVYFDDNQFLSLTGFIHAPALQPFWKTEHFRTMTRFYDDVKHGMLPAYSFVEPRMTYDHNDMHPPVGPLTATDVDGHLIESGAISDVRAGEALLHHVYSSIRESASVKGSNAMNTMLFVTFDEHGGLYDHVPPPAATPPSARIGETEMGFGFDRLGVRVPALAISAWTAKGHVIGETMHHSSVAATLEKKYDLKAMTRRDAGAPTIDNAVTLGTPRQPGTWPQTHPQWIPPNPEAGPPVEGPDGDRPLGPPGVGLLGMLIAHYGGDETKVPRTYREAYELIGVSGKGLFGTDARSTPSSPSAAPTGPRPTQG
ncbi:alkaline phosphatase family protein [Rathayibacter sp. KR2-224]|uniref:alkaline phosphatase family protein n=1 Tax=Rathayibacter sp. KR2-224 TaxID=3400913 RepID=UPI003C07E3D0